MTKLLYRILDRLFDHEVINGHGRQEYLHRWVLYRSERSCVYLHHFVGSDWSRDVHDHPKPFTSIGLWGRYREHSPGGGPVEYRAPWLRRFPAKHIHRLTLAPGETCWTLCRVGSIEREWGFWIVDDLGGFVTSTWVPWKTYVRSSFADTRVAPPFEETDER